MTAPLLESFLARIYVDELARQKFLFDPEGEAKKAGLSTPEIEALVRIDREGLELIAESLKRKRGRTGLRR